MYLLSCSLMQIETFPNKKMIQVHRLFVLILSIVASTTVVQSFSTIARGGLNGGSTFVIAQRFQLVDSSMSKSSSPRSRTALQMGNTAKFGIFSPAVYITKIVLGQDKLNKIRGKAISLHSEAIGDFCLWAGAYHLRTKLIKKAKTNGDTLGFLV